jgi:hypothetical protein
MARTRLKRLMQTPKRSPSSFGSNTVGLSFYALVCSVKANATLTFKDLKAAHAISFKPFDDLRVAREPDMTQAEAERTLEERQRRIEEHLHLGEYDEAQRSCEALTDVVLSGLEYLQKCPHPCLLSVWSEPNSVTDQSWAGMTGCCYAR